MKKLKALSLLTLLVITSCAANGRGSKGNIMDSLFNSNKSSNQSQIVTSNSNASINSISGEPVYDKIDIDLTKMNSTMVYSQVLNMLENPSTYLGKIVKMSGPFRPYYNENDESMVYPAIVIPDATACCASGLEFLLYGVPLCTKNGGAGYPNLEEEATIVGKFAKYYEYGYLYVHLVDAIWLKQEVL